MSPASPILVDHPCSAYLSLREPEGFGLLLRGSAASIDTASIGWLQLMVLDTVCSVTALRKPQTQILNPILNCLGPLPPLCDGMACVCSDVLFPACRGGQAAGYAAADSVQVRSCIKAFSSAPARHTPPCVTHPLHHPSGKFCQSLVPLTP